jgi:hypothetical protein
MTSKQQIFAGLIVIFLSLGIPITIAAIFGHFARLSSRMTANR